MQVKTLTYFTLKAAIMPAVCVMEVGGAEYEGQPVTMGPFTNDLCKVMLLLPIPRFPPALFKFACMPETPRRK